MKIGYPCLNTRLGCSSARTFRLRSYSPQRLVRTVDQNLDCLERILRFNADHGLLFFRLTSDLVPFASHPVAENFDWAAHFAGRLGELGRFIRDHGLRLSMHPDQFILLNSPDPKVLRNSVAELRYHARLLDLLGLPEEAKIQIHVGGVYRDKTLSLFRFADRCLDLEEPLRRRLVIENDERSYGLKDCLMIHLVTGLPVVLDVLHHHLLNEGESLREALAVASATWSPDDGPPIVDYSRQRPGGRRGRHADSLEEAEFRAFLHDSQPYDFDLMLEIKDKERSALHALEIAAGDARLATPPGVRRPEPETPVPT
ncbi:MAG: UV DNA damage repair endonuclease UvsE [Candidatus Zixiibacteriota bacterium]|nr:MAG: UV DNA damage repair endonuclease UvsE [candidate division Zixibacteria bacterium]